MQRFSFCIVFAAASVLIPVSTKLLRSSLRW
jgi:hypothetical protein